MLSAKYIRAEAIYASFRAENKKPWVVVLNIGRYMLKYFLKKRRYSEEDIGWAEKVNSISQRLMISDNKNLKIGLLGDIMWVRKVDESIISAELIDKMQNCEFWIGNLETPLVPAKKVKSFWPDYIKYGSSASILKAFRHGEKNLLGMVSLANNHILDAGEFGLETTREALTKEGILFSGTDNNFNVKVSGGIKIGFYALTYGTNSTGKLTQRINILDHSSQCISNIKEIFRQMDEASVDMKVLSLHWGHEFEFIPSSAQRELAKELVRLGADIILGHHPHVIQPIEVLFLGGYEKTLDFPVSHESCLESSTPRKALVIYSAGNFITDMITSEVRVGMGLVLDLYKNGRVIDWQISEIILVDNKPSRLFRPHATHLSENKFAGCCEKVSH